jgi:hypothetical protein
LVAEIPGTHPRGSTQINAMLATLGIALFIDELGLLEFDVIFQTDRHTFLIDINLITVQACAIGRSESRHIVQEDPKSTVHPSQCLSPDQGENSVKQIRSLDHGTRVQI